MINFQEQREITLTGTIVAKLDVIQALIKYIETEFEEPYLQSPSSVSDLASATITFRGNSLYEGFTGTLTTDVATGEYEVSDLKVIKLTE